MASQRAHITALLDQLADLGNKRTGMPIDADEWNSLIDTVRGTLEVAAAQDDATSATLDQRYAPGDHLHLAEVTNEWLDADLRAAVAAGGTAPSVSGSVAGVNLGVQVGRLLDEIGRVHVVLEDQQARIDRTITDDLDRTKSVSDLHEQVAAVNDLRGVVSGVERRLRATTTQIDGLEALRSSLTDEAGATIDVGALRAEVSELSRLRESLTDDQGNLVRMRDVLARIEEGHVTGSGGLDERFGVLRGELSEHIDQRLSASEDRLNATADDRAAQTRADVLAQVNESLTSTRSELTQLTETRVSAAEQHLDASLASSLQNTAAGLQRELSGIASAAVSDGLGDVDARIGTAVDAAKAQVGDSLRAELSQVATAAVDARVGAATEPLSHEVTDLGARVDAIDATVDASVGEAVDARFEQVASAIDARTSARIDEARTALAASIADEVGTAVTDQVGDLDARVGVTVDTRLADVDARIDQRIAVATAALPDTVRAEVKTQIADLDVPGQLSALESSVTSGYRSEIAAAETRIESRRSTTLNDLATQLRNEDQASAAGLEQRLSSELATQRQSVLDLRDRIGGLDPTRTPVRPVG